MSNHRAKITAGRAETNREFYGTTDVRKVKKIERTMSDPIHDAYILGSDHGFFKLPKRNPYPAGKRHDVYNSAYASYSQYSQKDF